MEPRCLYTLDVAVDSGGEVLGVGTRVIDVFWCVRESVSGSAWTYSVTTQAQTLSTDSVISRSVAFGRQGGKGRKGKKGFSVAKAGIDAILAGEGGGE